MLLNKRLANARVPYLWKIINFKIGFCWKIFSIVSAKIGLDNFCWARRNCSWFSRQLWQASQELNTYSIIWLLLLLTKVYKWWVGPTWLKSIPHSKLISLKTPKNKKTSHFHYTFSALLSCFYHYLIVSTIYNHDFWYKLCDTYIDSKFWFIIL